MRKVLVLLALLLVFASALAFGSSMFSIGTDFVAIDSFFLDSMRLDFSFGYASGLYRVALLLRYAQSFVDDLYYMEAGAELSIYPFSNGFFVGCSLIKMGVFWGLYKPDEDFLFSGEGFVGWTFHFPYCYLEPRFTFNESFGKSDSMDTLRSSIVQFNRFRLSLIFGVEF